MADGSCVARRGQTAVLVTAVAKERPGATSPGYLPLTVDFRNKAASVGRIPLNRLRRETGPSEFEVLSGRVIDRSLRPLFPPNFLSETQVIGNVLSMDGVHDPVVVAVNGASAALALSDIPWSGPVGCARVALLDEEVVVNPTRKELEQSTLDLVISAADQNLVVMMEASAHNVLQQHFLKAIKAGVRECQKVVQAVNRLAKERGKAKREVEPGRVGEELLNLIGSMASMRLRHIFTDTSHDKFSRDDAVRALWTDIQDKLRAETRDSPLSLDTANQAFGLVAKRVFRELVLEGVRCDGRGFEDLRDISCSVDLYPPLHGSALFQRGQTQVLCTVSLDSLDSALTLDPITALASGLEEKNFLLHYDFPPYATNEVGRVGPAARREVGHGALAERGLRPLIPQDLPFTVRLNCEVLESNGSSSMASVCAGSLALMDAGVPLPAPAAGVAVGLVTSYRDNDTKHIDKYQLLTDILGIEDYMGDMDFKIAGTKKGISAVQADIKVPGLPLKIVMEAVLRGCDAKSAVIDIMNRALDRPRTPQDKKDSWPVSETLDVPVNKRGRLIGPGGSNLRKISSLTGARLRLDEETGLWNLFAPNQGALDEAKQMVERAVSSDGNAPTLEFGGVYTARVAEVRESGLMVTLYEGMKPALLHVSQLDQRRVSDARVLGFTAGQQLTVKYFGVDPVNGHVRLSRKVLMGPSTNRVVNLDHSATDASDGAAAPPPPPSTSS